MGATVGVVGAAGLTRILTSLLYGVDTFDALAYAAGITGVLAISLCASYLPARRAARVDPIEALRR